MLLDSAAKNGIFAVKSTEGYNPGQCERSNKERPIGNRHPLSQIAHFPDILLMMHGQLSRWLGADIFTAEGHLRLAGALIDFYSQPLLSPELAEQARATVRHLQGAQPATERPAT